MECAGTQIAVQTILPGPVHSEFFEQSGITKPMFPENLYMTPEQLVATSMRALELKESLCFPALQDVSLDFSFNLKELYGQYQFPLAIARGHCFCSSAICPST